LLAPPLRRKRLEAWRFSARGWTTKSQTAVLLPISAVFYAESVEQKAFVYAEKEVYRSRLKLYALEKILLAGGFPLGC